MKPHRLLFNTRAIISIIFLLATFHSIEAQRHKDRLVETVDVMGNRRFTDVEILKYVKTRVGEPFSAEQVQLDVQTILATGFFDKIQTRVITEEGARGGLVITFEVWEMPVIKELKFEGLRNIEDSEIINLLRRKKINISVGSVRDPVQIRMAAQAIKEFLLSHNWSNVSVTTSLEDVDATSVSLTLIIKGNNHPFVKVSQHKSSREQRLTLSSA